MDREGELFEPSCHIKKKKEIAKTNSVLKNENIQ